MTTALYDYPKSAAFGRVLPKSKIYAHARPTTAVKDLFVRQVDKIVWQYKLATETIKLKQSKSVPEIQIFSIALKTGELKHSVLQCIDKAIQFPILFELYYEDKIQVVSAFKRRSDADRSKWVVSEYFESTWLPADTRRIPLPIVFDIESLYEHLLKTLMPFPIRDKEELKAYVDRMELIKTKQRELKKCETRLRKEKQFNRKVAINAELRNIKDKIKLLIRTSTVV